MMAGPAGAPGVVRFPFLGVGEDVVCSYEHAVPFQAHSEGQVVRRGAWVAAVWVVELDECIVAVLLV